MKAFLTLRMDRPIEKDKHYISPGGYAVRLDDGSTKEFDFMDSYGYIDDNDPCVIRFELRHPDSEYPGIYKLCENMYRVTALTECFVYTGESDEPEINVAKIEAFCIVDTNISQMLKHKDKYPVTDTDIVTFKEDKDADQIIASFSRKALDECWQYSHPTSFFDSN